MFKSYSRYLINLKTSNAYLFFINHIFPVCYFYMWHFLSLYLLNPSLSVSFLAWIQFVFNKNLLVLFISVFYIHEQLGPPASFYECPGLTSCPTCPFWFYVLRQSADCTVYASCLKKAGDPPTFYVTSLFLPLRSLSRDAPPTMKLLVCRSEYDPLLLASETVLSGFVSNLGSISDLVTLSLSTNVSSANRWMDKCLTLGDC